MKIGRMANFRSENSNTAFIFVIDNVFINYSKKMTYCHFGVKRGQEMIKIGRMADVSSESSAMTLIFEIDMFFINYLR